MSQAPNHKAANKKVWMSLSGVALAMLGLGFASKPLYAKFCQVTGYGGTTQVATRQNNTVLDRVIKVQFDANTRSDLPWEFGPLERSVNVKLGQNALVFYTAKNLSKIPVVGTASYNVTPIKAAPYFSKIECFCFTEQKLEPGEEVKMPILFFVDPEMVNDPRLDEIKTITLSYTFHNVENPDDDANTAKERSARLAELEQLDLIQ